jgi:predicted acyltransferase
VTQPVRISSLDQFRGYSVAAMFVVNFLGGLAITHHVLKHNNTHFSYADSIMPSFIFICGFSYRMSLKKRLDVNAFDKWDLYKKFVVRSLGLILLSLILTSFNSNIANWSEFSLARIGRFLAELIKANMWEVLAIIGALQILIMPVIARATWVRVLAILTFGLLHFWACWSFNYAFVYGQPTWLDSMFGSGKRAWDGGCFGLLAWGQMMLAGTVVYDLSQSISSKSAFLKLFTIGTVAMVIGYGMSCLTTLYDLKDLSDEDKARIVASPVIPDFDRSNNRPWTELFAEPPFFKPPPASIRAVNYWMMDKRIVTQSFVWFSTGFAIALFSLFILACDVNSMRVGLFEMFGKNPLAAYIINHMVNHAILAIVPKNSPVLWSIFGLTLAFGITWLFVKFLDDRKLYLRL